MEKILTISIAAYNVEKYIGQALDSLIDERVIDALEIFVVDDGSTDRTLEVAKEYGARFPQSVFPVHKENGGYGTTINYSIEHATGKYFKTLDGDDWYNTEGLYELVCRLREADVDVVVTGGCKVRDGAKTDPFPDVGVWSKTPAKISGMKNIKPLSAWNITYKTNILKRSGLKLPSKMLYTDQYYVAVPFTIAETIQQFDIDVYCYRIGREGQSISIASARKHGSEIQYIATELCQYYKEHIQCPNHSYLCIRISSAVNSAYKSLLVQPITYENYRRLKSFEEKISSIAPDIYRMSDKVGKMGKAVSIIHKTHYIAYWFIFFLPRDFFCRG